MTLARLALGHSHRHRCLRALSLTWLRIGRIINEEFLVDKLGVPEERIQCLLGPKTSIPIP